MSVFKVEKPERQTTTYTLTQPNIPKPNLDDIYFHVTTSKNEIEVINYKEGEENVCLTAKYLALIKLLLARLEREGYALAYQTKEATQA